MSYNYLRKIYSSSIVYSLANSIEALNPLILAIILTRKLSPDEYGIWVLFIALVTFLRPVISLSIQDALKMHYFNLNRKALSNLVLASFYVTTSISILFVVLVFFTTDLLSVLVKFPASWLISIVICAYFFSIFYFMLAYNQFEDNKQRFILLHVIQSSISISLSIVLVVAGWEWQGAIIGKIIGLASVSFLAGPWLLKDFPFTFSTKIFSQAKQLVKFGLHYFPTGLGLVIIPLTDRLVISHVLGLYENGLYGVAALFSSAFFVIVNGFLLAWMPWLFKKLIQSDKAAHAEIRRVSLSFMLLLPLSALCFYVFCIKVAPFIIGTSFDDAFPFIPWVIATCIMQGYFFHNQAFLLFKKAVILMSLSSSLCIVLNIVLSYIFSLTYGIRGVIIATIISYALTALLSGAVSFLVYKDNKRTRFSYV